MLQISPLCCEGLSEGWSSGTAVDLHQNQIYWKLMGLLSNQGKFKANLLRSFRLSLVTTCKVSGAVGPTQSGVFSYILVIFFHRSWFSQGSSASITGPDFVAMEAGGDRLPSERWSFFGPKAIQKSTNDPGMSSKISCIAGGGENC